MILNFLDPALERLWHTRHIPDICREILFRYRSASNFPELYQVLDRLNETGLNGMKGREVEKTGSVYRVTIRCGFIRFRLAGRDVADVGFETALTRDKIVRQLLR